MAVLALALIGEFTKVQDGIAGLADVYVRRRAPGVLTYLEDRDLLDKIPDRNRADLVIAIDKELNTGSDLSKFKEIFFRVKQVRDYLAHSANTETLSANEIRLTKMYWVRKGKKEAPPLTVNRVQLNDRLHEARWLAQHVLYLHTLAGTATRVYQGGQQILIVQPPADPTDWDGREYDLKA